MAGTEQSMHELMTKILLVFRKKILVFIGLLGLTITLSMTGYHFYEDGLVYQELENSIRLATRYYGPPRIPIQNVQIQYEKGPTNFTYLLDESNGEFLIQLVVLPHEKAFKGALSHEALHLLNQKLVDAYFEGICCVFSEEYTTESGGNWESYRKFFAQKPDLFDSVAYQMMHEIKLRVTPQQFHSIPRYAVQTQRGDSMHIDIDQWICSLPEEEQTVVAGIIRKYQESIQRSLPKYYKDYDSVFTIPNYPAYRLIKQSKNRMHWWKANNPTTSAKCCSNTRNAVLKPPIEQTCAVSFPTNIAFGT